MTQNLLNLLWNPLHYKGRIVCKAEAEEGNGYKETEL